MNTKTHIVSVEYQKTRWFDPEIGEVPQRIGVYEVDFDGFKARDVCQYQYWDGKRFYYGESNIDNTYFRGINADPYDVTPKKRAWRGLVPHNPWSNT